ncbi:polyprenyl synthetase family protein [Streptomyces sp. cg36]|uniref:polyprenyl synthetase family protein n=1 Tax=Streptomyces sp. cg36 TaxID=3238798 RepID=UPI0034E1E54F
MTTDSDASHAWQGSGTATLVNTVLDTFLADKMRQARSAGLPLEVGEVLGRYLGAGGKRLRPRLCLAGYRAAGGLPALQDEAVRVAASLELFHAFALIHDDILDQSSLRRGQPTVHCRLTARHARSRARDADWLGISQAILVGDMAFAWADELLFAETCAKPCLNQLRQIVQAMREEVLYGQYLDLLNPLGPADDLDAARRIIRYKTAKYTVERPLHIGAVLAGADEAFCAALSRYALPLGEAFQLRDDLLGVFGDPHHTGKSTLDDLREGKHTMLLALAHQRAAADQSRELTTLVGNPDLDEQAADHIRSILDATGARATVEDTIDELASQARLALQHVEKHGAPVQELHALIAIATDRAS